MPRRSGSERKRQITQVAMSKFREKGYHAVSMRELADHVGIEAPSFYNHFESKENILKEICFRMADAFFQRIRAAVQEDADAVEQLHSAITSHIEVIAANLDAAAVFFHDWRHLKEPWLSQFKSMRFQYEEIFRNIVRQGMRQGLFRPQDETLVVLTLFGQMNWLYEWYDAQGKLTPHQLAQALATIFLEGILNKKKI